MNETPQDVRDSKQDGMVKSIGQQDIDIAVILNDIKHINSNIICLNVKMDDFIKILPAKFVSKEEFSPVRSIAYGMVGVICLAVVGALVALVLTT